MKVTLLAFVFPLVLMFTGIVGLVSSTTLPGCTAPTTVTTDMGKRAYTADQVVVRIGEFQQAVIDASDAKKVPEATARVIVFWTVQSMQTLKSAPVGWDAALRKTWPPVRLEVAKQPALATWAPIIDALIGG